MTTTTKQPAAVTEDDIQRLKNDIACAPHYEGTLMRVTLVAALLAERERLLGKSAADDQALSSYEATIERLREALRDTLGTLVAVCPADQFNKLNKTADKARAALGGGGK